VATIAFGMGIDLPHVRYVLHWSMSKTIEGFYQESGRAGRDSKQALSIVYYSKDDASKFLFLIQCNRQEDDPITESFEKMVEYCTKSCCKRQLVLSHFGEKSIPQKICNKCCDYCLDDVHSNNQTTQSQQQIGFRKAGSLQSVTNASLTKKHGFIKASALFNTGS